MMNPPSIPGIRRPWKKNLYQNQGYEDNYTDPSFLKDLQKNKNVRIFTLKEAIKGATLLNNQISAITVFLMIFYCMYNDLISPTYVLLSFGTVTLIGYTIYVAKDFNFETITEDCKTLLTVLLFGYMFSPLLYTLTDAISTDTIFFMTFLVMFLNLIFFDYGIDVAIVSRAISLNAAIFGSICLASRLTSSYHAFVLLVVAAEFFVLYPLFSRKFWNAFHLLPIVIICSLCLYHISIPLLLTYFIVTSFINFICPWIFINHQKYKDNIHGPWDEAIVVDSENNEIEKKE